MTDFQGPNMSHGWLDEMGAKLDTIVGQERQMNARELMARYLIGRMCAVPLVIQYEGDDRVIHTDERPECDYDNNPDTETCPCHWAARTQEQEHFGVTHAPDCRCGWCGPNDDELGKQI